jgi:hypothetical protein
MAFLVVCLFGLKYYLANWEFIRYAESIPVARPPFEASIWVIPEGAKLLPRCALRVLFETEPYHTTIIHCYQAIIPFLIVCGNIASDNRPYVKNTENGRKS